MTANASVFHVLDLDRTLLDTSKLAKHLKNIIAMRDETLAKNIDKQIVIHAQEKTSFFLFEYIAEQVGDERLQSYIHELHAIIPTSDLLLPGALDRIAFGKSRPGWGVGILTYGSKRDQVIKLKLMDLQMERLLVTDTPRKGDIIASWQQPDGKFKLPIEFGGHVVDIVTLDDDKHVAFENLPHEALGQWVTHASIGGATELQKISSNLKVVSDLEASIHYLKTKLYQ